MPGFNTRIVSDSYTDIFGAHFGGVEPQRPGGCLGERTDTSEPTCSDIRVRKQCKMTLLQKVVSAYFAEVIILDDMHPYQHKKPQLLGNCLM